MELVTNYDEGNDIVVAKGKAELNSESVREAVARAMKIAAQHDCHRFLFDISKCHVDRSLVAGFQDMSNIGETTGLSLKDKVAVLFDPSSYPEERARFIENVVSNRMNPVYKMFVRREDAITWLKDAL